MLNVTKLVETNESVTTEHHVKKRSISKEEVYDNNSILTATAAPAPNIKIDTSLDSEEENQEMTPISKSEIPMFLNLFSSRFTKKLSEIYFQPDYLSVRHSARGQQMMLVRRLALNTYKNCILEPLPSALNRTKLAAQDFYTLAHKLLSDNDELFPLANKNKCLGFAVFKGNKTVFIAVSQDKNARKDLLLRESLSKLIYQLNQNPDNPWRFELVKVPTAMEYLLPRTLRMETPRPASEFEIQPRMRCVEVHLMVALNKARRTIKYNPQDMAMIACGGTLWAHSEESRAIPHFGHVTRNTSYLSEPAVKVKLHDGTTGFFDMWRPCEEHCDVYYRDMQAIAAADEHFYGPRADEPLRREEETEAKLSSIGI